MTDTLKRNGHLVDGLRTMLSRTEGLDLVAVALRTVIETDAWRERVEERTGDTFGFVTFPEFVTARPLDGLGMTVPEIEAILKVYEEHDTLRLLREACKGNHGGDRRSEQAPIKRINGALDPKRGPNRRDATLARLHRDSPGLYDRVVAGELSANRAAIQAGFRKPTASIPVDTPEAAVTALLRRFDRDALLAVLRAQLEEFFGPKAKAALAVGQAQGGREHALGSREPKPRDEQARTRDQVGNALGVSGAGMTVPAGWVNASW